MKDCNGYMNKYQFEMENHSIDSDVVGIYLGSTIFSAIEKFFDDWAGDDVGDFTTLHATCTNLHTGEKTKISLVPKSSVTMCDLLLNGKRVMKMYF